MRWMSANISDNTAYYTGTHDNQTTLAWAKNVPEEELRRAMEKAGFSSLEEAPWALTRFVFNSHARIAVVPMQDLLGLDDWATMNRPGTLGSNWRWRMKPGATTPALAQKLAALNAESNRR